MKVSAPPTAGAVSQTPPVAEQPKQSAPPPPPPPPPKPAEVVKEVTKVEATVVTEHAEPKVSQLPVQASSKAMAIAPADLPEHLRDIIYTGEGVTPGFENVGASGLQLPMLVVAQPMTPAVVAGKLNAGDLFLRNDPEKAVITRGSKFEFMIAFHYREWIEWADRDSGLGILNRSKNPKGDLARKWATAFANRGGPKETRVVGDKTVKVDIFEYHVFFIVGEGDRELWAMPLSRTLYKQGNNLINLARKRIGCPIWSGKYEGQTVLETNKKQQSWYTYKFNTAGWCPPSDKEFLEQSFNGAKAMFDNVVLGFADEDTVLPDDVSAEAPSAEKGF